MVGLNSFNTESVAKYNDIFGTMNRSDTKLLRMFADKVAQGEPISVQLLANSWRTPPEVVEKFLDNVNQVFGGVLNIAENGITVTDSEFVSFLNNKCKPQDSSGWILGII